jgi:hypothetical protein
MRHDAFQRISAAAGSDDFVWPVWIVDVAEAERKTADLVSTIGVLDCGAMLTWQHIAQPLLAALGADYTGLSLHSVSSPVSEDVRRICLAAAYSGASAVWSISWPDSPPGAAQHLMAWPSPSDDELGWREIHLVILPASKADTPTLRAVPSAAIFAEATQIRM